MEKKETFKSRLWSKFKEETRNFFGPYLAFLFAGIYAITVGIARYYVLGWSSAMNYFLEWFVDAILTGIPFFIVLSIINLIRAPYSVGRDLLKEKKNLEDSLANMKNQEPNVIAQKVITETFTATIKFTNWTEPTGLSSGTSNLSTQSIVDIRESPIRSLGPIFERYYLTFKNTAMGGQKNIGDAEDVHAIVVFKNSNTLSHEKPRWFEQPAPPEHQGNINIKANGKPEGLYLMIREQGKKEFYVFSDDSYTVNSFDPLKDNLRLHGGAFDIRIRLRDKHGWHQDYLVKTTIANGEPIFDVISVGRS